MLRIQTIALGLALCGGVAVAAGAQEANRAARQKSDTTVSSGNRHQMRRGRMDRSDRGLFKGIELTSTERAHIDSIRTKYRADSKSLREQMMPAMKEARAARQSGDSAKVQAARANMSASREKMLALRKQEMAEIRGALTQQQQTTFDKNASDMQNRMRSRAGQRRGGPHGGSPRS